MSKHDVAYKKVKTMGDLPAFLAYWRGQLTPLGISEILDSPNGTGNRGRYYIETRRSQTRGRHFSVETVELSEIERIAKEEGYNLTNPDKLNGQMINTIARLIERLALKKLMRILEKYSSFLKKPLLLSCFDKEHALYDIYIPSLELFINVKSHNVYTSKVFQTFKDRANRTVAIDQPVLFTHNINPEKLHVLDLIGQTNVDLRYWSFPFAINYPGYRYHKTQYFGDSEILIPETIQGSSEDGDITNVKDLVKDISEQELLGRLFAVIKAHSMTERGFLGEIQQRLEGIKKSHKKGNAFWDCR
ncbi:MAG: hypothetical protein V1725_07825 [archaeon]